jgi:hypothetical protein
MIEEWLAELSVIAPARQKTEIEIRLLLRAYVERLVQFPADVVRHALLDHKWTWFPSWAELFSLCDRMSAQRRAMLQALIKGPQPAEPPREGPTEEEKARMQAYIAELFPDADPTRRAAAVEAAMAEQAAPKEDKTDE